MFFKAFQEGELRKGTLSTLDCHCMEFYTCHLIVLIKGVRILSGNKEPYVKNNLTLRNNQ